MPASSSHTAAVQAMNSGKYAGTRYESLDDTVVSLAAKERTNIDQTRQMSPELLDAIRDAGYFQLLLPSEYGGREMSIPDTMQLLIDLAEIDANVAWLSMVTSTTSSLMGQLEQSTAQRLTQSLRDVHCGSAAPNGKLTPTGDGYTLSGRWQWASASMVGEWFWMGALRLEEGKKPRLCSAIVPRADITFIDTWHTMGMRGTMSVDIELKEVYVPAEMVVHMFPPTKAIANPTYQWPFPGFLAPMVAATALGNAKGAFKELQQQLQGRELMAKRHDVRYQLAQVRASLQAAEDYLFATVDRALNRLHNKEEIGAEFRAETRLSFSSVGEMVLESLHKMHALAGGAVVYDTNPLQLRLRDGMTMSQHILISRIGVIGAGEFYLTGEVPGNY